MLAMILSATDPDWDVGEDWAPNPDRKDETPSQVSMYSDDESGIPELQGIVVNTKDLRGQIYVAPEESLTLTTVDDDEEFSESEDDFSEGGSDSTDELPDDYDDPNELDTNNNKDMVVQEEGDQDGGTMTSTLNKDNETLTSNQQQQEPQPSLNGEGQLQKVSELAKSATDRAAEAGKQISSFLFGGLNLGMAGMVKHLESIEQAVQNQMEQTQPTETRDTPGTTRQRTTGQRDKTTVLEKRAAEPVASQTKSVPAPILDATNQCSFEQSTISSMGDTFQEYFKSRLLQQRRLQQQQRAKDYKNEISSPKATEKRIIDFDEKMVTDTKKKSGGTTSKVLVPNSKKALHSSTLGTTTAKKPSASQPKASLTKSKAANTKLSSNAPRKGSNPRGRQRSLSRPNSQVEARSPGPSRGRQGRSQSRKRDQPSRSRSRPRGKSMPRKEAGKKGEISHPSKHEATRQVSPRRQVVEKKAMAGKKRDEPQVIARHALERGRSTTQKVILSPRGTKPSSERPMERGVATTAAADIAKKSKVRSTSSRPPPERKAEEGVEMVPFTAKSGASGLLIINSGQCNLSSTPKAIRDTLQGKTVNPSKTPTRGRSKTPQQGKRSVKSSVPIKKPGTNIWSLRKEPSMTSNRRSGATNILSGKVMKVESRKRDKSQSGSWHNKDETPSPDDLDDMIDAITKFRLTAKKLGVAEDDLLQAMSFATQQNDG